MVNPPAELKSFFIDETPPPFGLGAISPSGWLDSMEKRIRFGPFTGTEPRLLQYTVIPPPGTAGFFRFSGVGNIDGVITPILGDGDLFVPQFPPPPLWLRIRERPLSQTRVLQIHGQPQQVCEILVTRDFRDWTIARAVTNITGTVEFTAPDVTSASQAFYRVRQKP